MMIFCIFVNPNAFDMRYIVYESDEITSCYVNVWYVTSALNCYHIILSSGVRIAGMAEKSLL